MCTFILRARKGSVKADKIFSQVGSGAHFEIIAHVLINAFYFSNGMRNDVDVYIVLESTSDFPRTLKFSSHGLSFPGFHEQAILSTVSSALSKSSNIIKDSSCEVEPGIVVFGFGFDSLMRELQEQHQLYLLDKKGEDIRTIHLERESAFILSDHLPMPKNSIKGLERRGLKKMSLGPKMLFASQCVTLIHNELDKQFR